MGRARSLWRDRDFMVLWGGQSIGMAGSHMTELALPFVALTLLHASPFEMSVLAAAGYAPWLLVSLPAGVLVDRRRRRPLMVWCNVGQAVALASVPVAAAGGFLTLAQLAVAALVVAMLTVVYETAYQSYLPSLVPGERLVEAHGKLGISSSLAEVVGKSSAGALVALLGAARTLLIDVVSYLVSAVSLLMVRTREPEPGPGGGRLRVEIAEGLRYVFRDRLMRPVVVANALASLGIGGVSALWLVYVYRELRWSPAAAGLCLGLGAAGGVVGGLLAAPLARRLGLPRLMLLTAPAYAFDLVLTLLAGPGLAGQVVVTAGYVVTMAGEVVYVISNRSFRQLVCPPHLMGRMNATARWLAFGPKPFVALAFGLLATWAGLPAALAAGVVVFALPAVVLVMSPLRTERDLGGLGAAVG